MIRRESPRSNFKPCQTFLTCATWFFAKSPEQVSQPVGKNGRPISRAYRKVGLIFWFVFYQRGPDSTATAIIIIIITGKESVRVDWDVFTYQESVTRSPGGNILCFFSVDKTLLKCINRRYPCRLPCQLQFECNFPESLSGGLQCILVREAAVTAKKFVLCVSSSTVTLTLNDCWETDD